MCPPHVVGGDSRISPRHVPRKSSKKGAAELNDLGKKVAGAKKNGKIDWSKIPAVAQK